MTRIFSGSASAALYKGPWNTLHNVARVYTRFGARQKDRGADDRLSLARERVGLADRCSVRRPLERTLWAAPADLLFEKRQNRRIHALAVVARHDAVPPARLGEPHGRVTRLLKRIAHALGVPARIRLAVDQHDLRFDLARIRDGRPAVEQRLVLAEQFAQMADAALLRVVRPV